MRTLITGISGFIGSAVYKQFIDHGHTVYTIDNLSFGSRELIEIPDNQFFIEDIRNRERVFELVSEINPEWVVHLAAIHFIPYCNKHPFEATEVNIQGSKNIFDACAASGSVRKMMFASTAAVYPIMEDPINEDVIPRPSDIYGMSKLTGEYLAELFHLKTNTPTVICRFFNAFGPNETNPHLIPVIQEQINAGQREILLGNLEPKRDFIHTSDMARAIYALMERFENGYDTFNLGSGVEYSVLDIVDAFSQVLNEKIFVRQDPEKIRKVDRMHLLADIKKLINFINWRPVVSIEEGISTLIIR
jgi:UDP-glucose 4-epimerase